ncbi:hypothetical protein CCHR01_20019, partial [Colletotrichum chrysophilum]
LAPFQFCFPFYLYYPPLFTTCEKTNFAVASLLPFLNTPYRLEAFSTGILTMPEGKSSSSSSSSATSSSPESSLLMSLSSSGGTATQTAIYRDMSPDEQHDLATKRPAA